MPYAERLTDRYGVAVIAKPGEAIGDIPSDDVARWFAQEHVVLFRGFRVTKSEFVQFSNRFCVAIPHFLREPASDEQSFANQFIYNVYYSSQITPRYLHSELSNTPMMPGICWFHCVRASISGGETTLGDGTEVFERLSEPTKSLFLRSRIAYTWDLSEARWKSTFKISGQDQARRLFSTFENINYSFRDDGSLQLVYATSAVHIVGPDKKPAFVNAIADYQREREWTAGGLVGGWITFEDGAAIKDEVFLEVKEVCQKTEHPIVWNDGDVVLVDNRLIMHGRRIWPSTDIRLVYARFGNPSFVSS